MQGEGYGRETFIRRAGLSMVVDMTEFALVF